MKRRLIVPVLAVVVAGTIAVGAATVSAQSIDESGYPSIVTKIAEHFNLNKDEVKAIFDEERDIHQADMQQRMEERLTEAVTAGDLTEEQKQAILTKHEEMQTQREANFEAMKNMSQEDRRATMQAQRDELDTWAADNGIDLKYLRVFDGQGRGHGGPGMMMHRNDVSETATETAI